MSTKRSHWIPVVTALMHKDGRILVGQRPQGQSLPGVWEFPGGKIEMSETPEQALHRELKEELGIDADIGPLAFATTHNYSQTGTGIVLLFYQVYYWKGEIKPVHHTELKWITPQELRRWPLPEANQKILDRLISVMAVSDAPRISL